jgi:hypothetical protein
MNENPAQFRRYITTVLDRIVQQDSLGRDSNMALSSRLRSAQSELNVSRSEVGFPRDV